MNILLAGESFRPTISGVAVVVEHLAKTMAERGHTVTVLAPSDDHHFKKEISDGYVVYRLPSRPNPFRKGLRFTTFSYRYIKRAIDETRPDVVHVHDPAALCRGTARRARMYGIPVVVTQHFVFEYILTYLPTLKQFHPLLNFVAQKNIYAFYNRCDCVVVPTKTLKEYLLSPSLRTPVVAISNGVDTARFIPRPDSEKSQVRSKYGVPLKTPCILYIGRLDQEKNLSVVLEALALLQKKMPAHLVIVGGGNFEEGLKTQAEELGATELITWISPIRNLQPDFPSLYGLGDVFCIPCPIETESIVTLEAMASGLPIVSASCGAVTELVTSGENGFSVASDDAAGWSDAFCSILSDSSKREQMGKASREKVMARDRDKSLNKLEVLYQNLIRG
jgi:glycosyltransferase involved in cell wall biosynthesis